MSDSFPFPNSRCVLVACMPKSGSTFLSALIASTPGFRREHIVPSYRRREQELSEPELLRAYESTQTLRRAFDGGALKGEFRPKGFVSQNHVRHTHETQVLLDKYGITPIVLVRNIFDIVVSLRDHVTNESVFTPLAYVDESMRDWQPEEMYSFLVDMAVPWYIHFYVSWQKANTGLIVRYEDLVADPRAELKRVLTYAKLPRSEEILDSTLEKVEGVKTRKNVGKFGRGERLSKELKDKIKRLSSYYPDVDFSPIGL